MRKFSIKWCVTCNCAWCSPSPVLPMTNINSRTFTVSIQRSTFIVVSWWQCLSTTWRWWLSAVGGEFGRGASCWCLSVLKNRFIKPTNTWSPRTWKNEPTSTTSNNVKYHNEWLSRLPHMNAAFCILSGKVHCRNSPKCWFHDKEFFPPELCYSALQKRIYILKNIYCTWSDKGQKDDKLGKFFQ